MAKLGSLTSARHGGQAGELSSRASGRGLNRLLDGMASSHASKPTGARYADWLICSAHRTSFAQHNRQFAVVVVGRIMDNGSRRRQRASGGQEADEI